MLESEILVNFFSESLDSLAAEPCQGSRALLRWDHCA